MPTIKGEVELTGEESRDRRCWIVIDTNDFTDATAAIKAIAPEGSPHPINREYQLCDYYTERITRNYFKVTAVYVQVMWIVGHLDNEPWQFIGLFATEKEAVAACLTSKYFVAPATVGEIAPNERTEWPGCYYPIVKHEGSDEVSRVASYEEWNVIREAAHANRP